MKSKYEEALIDALLQYADGYPVVIRDRDGGILHGRESLESLIALDMPLTAVVVSGIPVEEWNASEWPERLEAARQLFMQGAL